MSGAEEEMLPREIDQFLTCARVGRLGVFTEDGPYITPVGYGYSDGKIFFHSCNTGLKMDAMRRNSNVCFEVDESLSDASMYKSVVTFGEVEIIEDEDEMIPYLQKLIDKYRVLVNFDEYMSRPERDRKKELKAVRVCIITPRKMTGRRFLRNPSSI